MSSNPYRLIGARFAVDTAIAQARTAVTRLNRPSVKQASTPRQTTQTGRSQASGTANQSDQADGVRSARNSSITSRLAQPASPR